MEKALFMVCDRNDILGRKEDKFTMVAAPLVAILFVIPWSWWLLKHLCSCMVWCCTWEIYVDEEEDSAKKSN